MEASVASGGTGERLVPPSSGKIPDQVLKWSLLGVGVLVLLIIIGFFVTLLSHSSSALGHAGFSYVFSNNWDPTREIYKGASLVVGTLVTSVIALIIGVPVAVATALYVTELCPRRLRAPLGMLIDLLAAVPSVVYGLWGLLFLAPKLLGVEKWFANLLSFIPFVGGGADAAVPKSYFNAGLILAIMIVPIVSAIAREVISTVPTELKEGSLALGATRWEMLRQAVLPYSRPGITGGAMLGLGRALGETIAVTMVIGTHSDIGHHLLSVGNSLAAVIANEWQEAVTDPPHSSALFAAGLILFVLTLIINVLARIYIARGTAKLRVKPEAADASAGVAAAGAGV